MIFAFYNLFDYAGRTVESERMFWIALAVFALVLVALVAWVVRWCVKGRPSWWSVALVGGAMAVYLGVWSAMAGRLDHDWFYLTSNVTRSYDTYKSLVRKSAFFPPIGKQGKGSFVHLATQDYGFSKGTPIRTESAGGHEMSVYQDEDYGQVLTLDGRPLVTGSRYVSQRLHVSIVPVVECPYARSVVVLGTEARAYANAFVSAGLKVKTSVIGEIPSDIVPDIALITDAPEWTGEKSINIGRLAMVKNRLSRGGLCALHLNTRLMPAARAKTIFCEFGKVFPYARVWCVGRFDWVLTGFNSNEKVSLLADDLTSLFERKKVFETFLEAKLRAPSDVFASYVGTVEEVWPAFETIGVMTAEEARKASPRLAFFPQPEGDDAPLRPSDLMPMRSASLDWLLEGSLEADVFKAMKNQIAENQKARRMILIGLDQADRGKADRAIDCWAKACAKNQRDPFLDTLSDSLDLEGRRRLRVGDVNGAMRCYENLIVVVPWKISAIHNFGVCLKQSGRTKLAADVFTRAIAKDPENDDHRLEFIECAAAAGMTDLAVEQIDFLIKRHPNDQNLKLRKTHLLVNRFVKERDAQRKEKGK